MAKGKRAVANGGGGNRGVVSGTAGDKRDDPLAHAVKVEMSARAEERVRRALQGVSLDAVVAAALPFPLTEVKLRRAYDGLLARGFASGDVEQALAFVANVPTDANATADTGANANQMAVEIEALDWLCFTLATSRLPRRYQAGVRSAAAAPGSAQSQVQVVRAAEAAEAWDDDEIEVANKEAVAEAARAAAEAKANAETDAKAKAEADLIKKQTEATKAAKANREWIMSQYENSGENSGDSQSETSGSDHDSLEDFGVPPVEVERRAFCRRRKRQFDSNPQAHVRTMRTERDTARQDAASAKTNKDKSKQKAANEALRKLIDELSLYGMTLDDLEICNSKKDELEEDADFGFWGENTKANTTTGTTDADAESAVLNRAGGDGYGDDIGNATGSKTKSDTKNETKSEPSKTENPNEESNSNSDDDEFDLGVDLFKTDGNDTTTVLLGAGVVDELESFTLLVSPLFPPSQIAAPSLFPEKGKKGKKGTPHGSKKSHLKDTQTLTPKALLQMLCRREGWIAPRYDKANTADTGVVGTHYSVVVERVVADPTKGKKCVFQIPPTVLPKLVTVVHTSRYTTLTLFWQNSKVKLGGVANRAARCSTVTGCWPVDDLPLEGWPSVGDAQNAGACAALFHVLASVSALTSASGRGLPSDPNKRKDKRGETPGVAFAPQELDDTFLAAWRRWAEDAYLAEKEACGAGGDDTAPQGADARDKFVAGLMTKRRARDGAETKNKSPKHQKAETNVDSWEDACSALARVVSGSYGNHESTQHVQQHSKHDSKQSIQDKESKQSKDVSVSKLLADEFATKASSDPQWKDMWRFRQNLPVFKLRTALLDALRGDGVGHDAAVVCGETGSGKTTQVPQYLLDDCIERGVGSGCRVVCTQPRRVAALSVAERVSSERCERNGPGGYGSLVGHHVRLDAKVTKDTRLTFMTAGILLRKMHGDPLLSDVSHVVLDEIHERSLDGDFLLALLRHVPAKRRALNMPPLKLVVMSATLDAELFCGYLGNCPVVSAPGRTHPVEIIHLERIHDLTKYALDEDSRCCRKPQGASIGERALSRMRGDHKTSAMDNWGVDGESAWRGDENPDFCEAYYYADGDDADRNDGVDAATDTATGPSSPDTELETKKKDKQKYVPSGVTLRNLSRLDENRIDYDLIELLLLVVDESEPRDGAFLVFLPGIGEVGRLIDRLQAHPQFAARHGKHKLVPLHSALTPAEQREAFKIPGPGVRKIVVATNVAETSVTIPDVVVVVDSGRVKERQWDPRRGMASLDEGWVSRASARQRAGRAGRVRPGKCYAMFTNKRATLQMRHHQVPELHRVPLTEVVLQIKKLGVGGSAQSQSVGDQNGSVGSGDPVEFLKNALEPPDPKAVAAAVATLREIGALERLRSNNSRKNGQTENKQPDGGGDLTPLGHHLAALPVECRVAKMLVYGALLSCVSPVLTIAACLSYKSPFLDGRSGAGATGSGCDGARHALAKPTAGGLAAGEQSDHLVYAEAYDRWSKAVSEAEAAGGRNAGKDFSRRHAAKHGLSGETLAQIAEMRGQYASLLWDAGLLRTGGSTGTNNMHEHGGKQGNKIGRASSAPRGWVDDVSAGWNADSRTPKVVKAVIAAGLYANVAAIDFDDASSSPFGKKENATTSRWKDIKGEIGIHSASVNAKLGGFVSLSSGSANATSMTGSPLSPFLTFHEKIKTHRVFVRDCTILPPTALLLFCGGEIDVKHELGLVCLDGWLWLKASAQTAAVFRRVRAALDLALERRIANAHGGKRGQLNGKANGPSEHDNQEVVRAIRALLAEKVV